VRVFEHKTVYERVSAQMTRVSMLMVDADDVDLDLDLDLDLMMLMCCS
jgi:hypothetical protein